MCGWKCVEIKVLVLRGCMQLEWLCQLGVKGWKRGRNSNMPATHSNYDLQRKEWISSRGLKHWANASAHHSHMYSSHVDISHKCPTPCHYYSHPCRQDQKSEPLVTPSFLPDFGLLQLPNLIQGRVTNRVCIPQLTPPTGKLASPWEVKRKGCLPVFSTIPEAFLQPTASTTNCQESGHKTKGHQFWDVARAPTKTTPHIER